MQDRPPAANPRSNVLVLASLALSVISLFVAISGAATAGPGKLPENSVGTKQLKKSAVGFNAGVDVSRALSRRFAVGGLVRYSTADVKFDDPGVGKQTVKAGGVEVTAGVRIRF